MNSKKTYNCYDSLPEVVQKNKENVLDLYDVIGNFTGTFAMGKYYNQRDIVVYNGSQYYCIAEGFTSSKTPDTDPDNWVLYLAKGQTGATGAKGDTGTSIVTVENKGTTQGEGFTITHCEAMLSNGEKETFDVQAKDGATGATGATGVGITSVEATGTTQGDGYTTTHCKVTLTDGSNQLFDVKARDGSIDNFTANDLIALLLAGNGINVGVNGDKVEVGISRAGFQLGTPDTNGKGIKFIFNDTTEEIYLGSSAGGSIQIYNKVDGIDNRVAVSRPDGKRIVVEAQDITYHNYQDVKHYLREDNVKTLFGNQSIYGSGNIDLYRHTVTVTITGGRITFSEISSNNLNIDSLTDLKTVFGNSFNFGARGSVRGGLVDSVTADGYNIWYLGENTTWTRDSTTWASESGSGTLTILDDVKTV